MPWALSSIQWSGLPFFRESMQGVSAREMALYLSSSISPQPSRTTTRRGFAGFFIFGLGSSLKELPFDMVPIAPDVFWAPFTALIASRRHSCKDDLYFRTSAVRDK